MYSQYSRLKHAIARGVTIGIVVIVIIIIAAGGYAALTLSKSSSPSSTSSIPTTASSSTTAGSSITSSSVTTTVSSSSSSAMNATTTGPATLTNVKMSMGYTSWSLNTVPQYAAEYFGFFKAHNVNVTYDLVNGGPLAADALVAGQVNMAYGAMGAQVGAISTGGKMTIVLIGNTGAGYNIVTDNSITNATNIKGTTWGVESIGGASYEVDVEFLKAYNLSASDVNWQVVGSQSLRLQALIGHKVDAAALSVDQAALARPYSYLHVFANSTQVGETSISPTGSFAASSAFIQNDPAALVGVIEGYLAACRALSTNETLFAAVVNAMAPGVYNQSQIQSFYPQMSQYWAVNGGMNLNKIQAYLNLYYTLLNPSASPVSEQQIASYTFIQESLCALGTSPDSWDPVSFPTNLAC